jgi:hypothetical protein
MIYASRMSEGQPKSEGRDTVNRWWEYYLLRYSVGTVAGAVAIVFLAKFPGSSLHRSGSAAIKDFGSLEIKDMTALAALGFAYCYLASAPMLLLHATRAQIGPNLSRAKWIFWLITAGAIAFVYLVTTYCLSIPWWSYPAAGLLVFLGVVGSQVAVIVRAHWDGFETISLFYRNLAKARAIRAASVADYVQSYRHLREHGNALSILALEFALTFVLYSAPRLLVGALVMVFWFLPSTYSWIIGSILEAKLAHTPQEWPADD